MISPEVIKELLSCNVTIEFFLDTRFGCRSGDARVLAAFRARKTWMAGTKPGHDDKRMILEMLDAFRQGSQDAARRPRSHTPNAITTAPASANQVMAYCRWSSLRWTSSGPGLGMPLSGTGCSRSM
jgi:hypothetical protein